MEMVLVHIRRRCVVADGRKGRRRIWMGGFGFVCRQIERLLLCIALVNALMKRFEMVKKFCSCAKG